MEAPPGSLCHRTPREGGHTGQFPRIQRKRAREREQRSGFLARETSKIGETQRPRLFNHLSSIEATSSKVHHWPANDDDHQVVIRKVQSEKGALGEAGSWRLGNVTLAHTQARISCCANFSPDWAQEKKTRWRRHACWLLLVVVVSAVVLSNKCGPFGGEVARYQRQLSRGHEPLAACRFFVFTLIRPNDK